MKKMADGYSLVGLQNKNKIMEKQLFVIDGYRIWAFTYEEAYENYLQILRF